MRRSVWSRSDVLACLVGALIMFTGCAGDYEYSSTELGVTVERLDPALADRWGISGVVVSQAQPGSALSVGDLLTHIAYRIPVQDDAALESAIGEAMGPRGGPFRGNDAPSDGSVLLDVQRGSETHLIELAVRDPGDWSEHGAVFENLTVVGLDAGFERSPTESPARTAGLLIGDEVRAVIDEDQIRSIESLKASLARADAAEAVFVYTHELTGIRLQAIAALGKIGQDDAAVWTRLLDIMEDADDPATRRTAARALTSLSPQATDESLLSPMLAHLLLGSERDAEIRRSAAATIEVLVDRIGPDAFDNSSIDTIVAALEDPDPGVHFKAGSILSRIGNPSVAVLTDALENNSSLRVRDIAATALGQIGGQVARASLIHMLPDTVDVPLQLTIATALSSIGDRPSRQALQTLESSTRHSGLREFVRQLLGPGSTSESGG